MGLSPDGKPFSSTCPAPRPARDLLSAARPTARRRRSSAKGSASELSPDGRVGRRRAPRPSHAARARSDGRRRREAAKQRRDRGARHRTSGGPAMEGGSSSARMRRSARTRLYIQDVAGGGPRPLTPEGAADRGLVHLARRPLRDRRSRMTALDLSGGRRTSGVPRGGCSKTDFIWRNWSEDGRFVYAWNPRSCRSGSFGSRSRRAGASRGRRSCPRTRPAS